MSYKPLTNTKWADIHTVSPDMNLYWEQLADLAASLADMVPNLNSEQCRRLVDYAYSGWPLVLTWKTPLWEGTTETTKTTVIVESVSAPSTLVRSALPGRIRVRYSGFTHAISLRAVVNVEKVSVETTFTTE